MNWIDYCIIIIMILGVAIGFKKGLLKSIYSIICLLISIIIAKSYYKTLTVFLVKNTPLEEKVIGFLSEKAFLRKMLLIPLGKSPVFSFSENFFSDINTFAAMLVINAISILAIFLAARLILGIAEDFLSDAVEIPGVREVNRIGGAIIGLGKNVILIMLVFTVMTPISAMRPFSGIMGEIRSSVLAGYFYDYNFILSWIWTAALDWLNK